MKFKVTLVCPTTVRATITFEADSAQEAESLAIDTLREKQKEYIKAVDAYRNRSTHIAMPYPENAVNWDDSDALENADIDQLEIDDVEEQ